MHGSKRHLNAQTLIGHTSFFFRFSHQTKNPPIAKREIQLFQNLFQQGKM